MSTMDAFNIGRQVGKSKRSTFGMTSDTLLDQFNKSNESNREIQKLMAVEKYKNTLESPKEQAMADYYRASADYLKGGQPASNDLASLSQQSGFSEDDYILKPTINRFKGKTSVVNTPELKQPLDPKATAEIGSFRRTSQNLQNNLGMMTSDIKGRMGPFRPGAMRGSLGNTVTSVASMMGDKGAAQFATFKAETDKVFQQFRKETTGAQAALKELGWLEPDYPQATDPPEVYSSKANEALRRLKQGEELLLNLYSQRGFRVGDLRQGNPLERAANRADSYQDASLNGGVDVEAEKASAIQAINKGASAQKVAERFKAQTGMDLDLG